MLKFVLAGLFIFVLAALLQHPVPILEGVEVYSERIPSKTIEQKNEEKKIEEEGKLYTPQANLEVPNPELVDFQLISFFDKSSDHSQSESKDEL